MTFLTCLALKASYRNLCMRTSQCPIQLKAGRMLKVCGVKFYFSYDTAWLIFMERFPSHAAKPGKERYGNSSNELDMSELPPLEIPPTEPDSESDTEDQEGVSPSPPASEVRR
jgi:hypothetical protein